MPDDQPPPQQPLPPLPGVSRPSLPAMPLSEAALWWWALMIALLSYLIFLRRHGGWVQDSINIAVLAFLLLTFGFSVSHRIVVRRAAKKIFRIRKHAYGSPPHYVNVDIANIPGIDLQFYDSARAELERHGFRFLADQEGLHISKATRSRWIIRRLVSDDGTIRAILWNSEPGGFYELATELRAILGRDLNSVEQLIAQEVIRLKLKEFRATPPAQ